MGQIDKNVIHFRRGCEGEGGGAVLKRSALSVLSRYYGSLQYNKRSPFI